MQKIVENVSQFVDNCENVRMNSNRKFTSISVTKFISFCIFCGMYLRIYTDICARIRQIVIGNWFTFHKGNWTIIFFPSILMQRDEKNQHLKLLDS